MRSLRLLTAVLLLLGVVGCDVGEPDEPPSDPATRAIDPAPTDPSEYVEYGDTGAQPDLLPGGGAALATSRFRLRVAADGCRVRRDGGRGPDGLAWMQSSRTGTVTDPRGSRTVFLPRLSGTGVVSLVLLEATAGGRIVQQVSNTVRVRCR